MLRKSFVKFLPVGLLLSVLPGVAGAQVPVAPAADVSSTSSELAPQVAAPEDNIRVVQLPPGVIARVNGQPVSEQEWVDTCKRVAGPSILQVMINHVVVRQAAQALGIAVSDEEAEAEYLKAVSSAGGFEGLMANLAESGEALQDYKTRLRTNTLLRKLIEKSVVVTDDELRKVYLERYGRKAEVQVIVTQTQPDADSIVNRCRKGADFGTLASQESVDEFTGRNHGFLPLPLSEGFFPKPFGRVVITDKIAELLFNMKPGEIAGPITAGEAGYYVFKVTDVKAASPVSFDTVKDQLLIEAREARAVRKGAEYLGQLLRAAKIETGIPLQ